MVGLRRGRLRSGRLLGACDGLLRFGFLHRLRASWGSVEEVDADDGASGAATHIARDTPKTSTFGVAVGVESKDSEYVTLTTPTDKEGTEAALWTLLTRGLQTKCIVGVGEIRVHRGRVAALLDEIEVALP